MAGWDSLAAQAVMSVATVGGGRDRRGWPAPGASVTQSVGYRARVGCSAQIESQKADILAFYLGCLETTNEVYLTVTLRPGTSGLVSAWVMWGRGHVCPPAAQCSPAGTPTPLQDLGRRDPEPCQQSGAAGEG